MTVVVGAAVVVFCVVGVVVSSRLQGLQWSHTQQQHRERQSDQ